MNSRLNNPNLHEVKKLITNKFGQVFQRTYYVDNNQEEQHKKRQLKNRKTQAIQHSAINSQADELKRGDEVEIIVNDKKGNFKTVKGIFRAITHNARTKREGITEGLATILDENGVTRYRKIEDVVRKKTTDIINPDDLTSTQTTKKEEVYNASTLNIKQVSEINAELKIGDLVKFTVRVIVGDKTETVDKYAYVSVFRNKVDRGQLIHVLDADGKKFERYTHNTVKVNKNTAESHLTVEQSIKVTNLIDKLAEENKIYKKIVTADSQAKRLKNNSKITDLIGVIRGTKRIEDVVERDPAEIKKEQEKQTPEERAIKQSNTKKFKEDKKRKEKLTDEQKKEIEMLALKAENAKRIIEETTLDLRKKINNSAKNIMLYKNADQTVFENQLNLYRSRKNIIEHYDAILQHKAENKIPLTPDELDFKNNRPSQPTKPIKPTVEEPKNTETEEQKSKFRTIVTSNTVLNENVKKQAKYDQIMGMNITDAQKKQYIEKHDLKDFVKKEKEQFLDTQTRYKNLETDIAKIGKLQKVNLLKLGINQRIAELTPHITTEQRASLIKLFSDNIKQHAKNKREAEFKKSIDDSDITLEDCIEILLLQFLD
jgi:hypothetical protein